MWFLLSLFSCNTFSSLQALAHCILFYRKDNSSLSGRDEKPCVPEPLVLCIPMRRQRCCEVTAVLQFARQVSAGQVVAAQLFDGDFVDWQFQFVCEQFLSRVVALAVGEVLLVVPSRKPVLHNTPQRNRTVNMCALGIHTYVLFNSPRYSIHEYATLVLFHQTFCAAA